MLGTCGEKSFIISDWIDLDENLVDHIRDTEINDYNNPNPPYPLILKKIGIKTNLDCDCQIYINNRPFIISPNESLELGYNVMDIKSIKFGQIIGDVDGILKIRYLY